MRKCQCCRSNAASWMWQPELDSWYLPGWHIRGFASLRICDECKEKYESGETITVNRKEYTHSKVERP